jgi:hypothetical protein
MKQQYLEGEIERLALTCGVGAIVGALTCGVGAIVGALTCGVGAIVGALATVCRKYGSRDQVLPYNTSLDDDTIDPVDLLTAADNLDKEDLY